MALVQSTGPLDAKLVFVDENTVTNDKAYKLLGQALRNAGVALAETRIVNVSSPDQLRQELRKLTNAKVYVPLGPNPLEWLLGTKPPVSSYGEGKREGFISQWRGSIIPPTKKTEMYSFSPENYIHGLGYHSSITILPTFHPSAVLRQFTWHPWFLMDIRKAVAISKDGTVPTYYRRWYYNDPSALQELACSGIDLISIDTEMEPQIVAIATQDEVHVFEWSEHYRTALTSLLTSPRIVKIAHNWGHDYADLRVRKQIRVVRPVFDTQGAAHILNNALQKELSPHISTRYTNWPYHKWLTDTDGLVYCGMDAVVTYDAYWPQMHELSNRKLMDIAEHDHRLLMALMEMQSVGFKIDEVERLKVEKELDEKLWNANVELADMVKPIIETRIKRFKKPHLFQRLKKCDCCGGGKLQQEHCIICGGGVTSTTMKDVAKAWGTTQKEARRRLPACVRCNGTGKIVKHLPFNSDSSDQVADVIYRGLGIRPRKFKGKETVKAAQLDPIKDKHPIIAKVIGVSSIRAEYDTVARLSAGQDGLLHCVFDPFGTGSGRVAGKEGLIEVGTNPMNLPLEARRFIVPRDGMIFLYPDMAQIEARAVAVLSKDRNLTDAFTTPIDWPGNPRHGTIDSHTRVVQLFASFGVIITRDQAKRFTYACMYGGQASQLATELNAEAFRKGSDERLTVEQVQLAIDTFFRVFSGVKQYHQAVVDEVVRTRKVRCPYTGRERTWLGYIMDEDSKELKNEIAKQVWSYLPQHLAAYVLGLGLIDIYNDPDVKGLLTPLIHVHDALLIEAPAERVEEAKKVAISKLSRYIWGMSFPADIKTGSNWYLASGGGK